MSMNPYERGLRYLDWFTRSRLRAKKALEQYYRVLDRRGASDYSRDRVQSFEISDPTYLTAERMDACRKRWTKAEAEYEHRLDDLDRILRQIHQSLYRTVIVLYYVDGRTVKEMSEMLIKKDGSHYSPDTISNVKHQAIVEIGKLL